MANNRLSQEAIVHRLAEGLTDNILQQLFPEHTPREIRRSLCGRLPETSSGAVNTVPLAQTDKQSINRCRLFTDGASRGNPGQAGAGAVLLTDQGEELATCSVYLGICTNNIAEYKALLIGLDEARRCGCTELAVFLDSELIVRQVQGRYKVKSEALLPLFHQVQRRLAAFNHWSIAHVPRMKNTRADQLANQGIDTAAA
ncbi:MAG: ribonuclease HI family protein [Desulfobulbus oligotrophicus]|nr:ribonuclease HI family protein [Desulfobulbus oligotrophicus]